MPKIIDRVDAFWPTVHPDEFDPYVNSPLILPMPLPSSVCSSSPSPLPGPKNTQNTGQLPGNTLAGGTHSLHTQNTLGLVGLATHITLSGGFSLASG